MKKDLETPLFALQADQTYYLTNSETKEVGVLVFEWWHRDHNVGTAYEKISFRFLRTYYCFRLTIACTKLESWVCKNLNKFLQF